MIDVLSYMVWWRVHCSNNKTKQPMIDFKLFQTSQMNICDSTIAFTMKCDIPGRLRVKTTITHQVENTLSEKNIDPCISLNVYT